MTIKLGLIIDGEKSFLDSQVAKTYESWGFARENVTEETRWSHPQVGKSLFGQTMILHLNLEDKNDLKAFVKTLTDKKTKTQFTKPNWFGNGLIITCLTAQGTKKISTLIEKSKGFIFKKEKPEKRKDELMSNLSLPKESLKLVNYYVGEDYQMLLSFTAEMNKLSKEEQKKITPNKVLTYFPPIPGSILPWKFMQPLMDGDTTEAISDFKRTIKNTHILVPMLFLNRQISLLLRVAIARVDIPNNPKMLANSIGEKPYGAFWPVYNLAKRTSVRNVELAAIEVNKLENSIKGNQQVIPENQFIATIAKLGLLLNH